MSPPLVFKSLIAGRQTPPGSPTKWTLRTCDLRGCKNHENLNKCARCRTGMYCSRACQKEDWAHHKAYCKMTTDFAPILDPVNGGGEPPLQRHLRLWTARFESSLLCAAIVALHLPNHPSNIGKLGLCVTLHPRPHPESGSRFQLASAEVVSMAGLMETLVGYQKKQARGPDVGPTLAELHQQHRAAQRAKTGGKEDFAALLVIADNEGPHALPGTHGTELRFKPINIDEDMVRSPMLVDPTLDWYASLKYQVDKDIPNRERVPR
ncbi:hypothetical protein C8R46DRAFT_1057302 [Mycena filopes]|nr:hypothetical protein C8R46DRAFT_1057302 [Mycena filopes]